MWLVISTRPDISNAVRSVARYCFTPKAIHWNAALGIIAYINDTSDIGITYQRGTSVGISSEIFADADYANWASKATNRRSMPGKVLCVEVHVYVGFPGRRNVSHFRHQKQSTLPLVILRNSCFQDKCGVSYSPVMECNAFQSSKTIRAQCNSRKTRCRTQMRSTLTSAIIV